MELIKIYQGNVITAYDLYEFLEIKTKFSMWISRNLLTDFEEDKDFFPFLGQSTGGRQRKDYYLTINTGKKLAMMAKTPKGDQARAYFIKCEETLLAIRDNKRMEGFMKLETTKSRLKDHVLEIGGKENDYIEIDYAGRKIFFNGEPMPDNELPLVLIKGRDFATEMTNEGLKSAGIADLETAKELNKINHRDVREILKANTGQLPEKLKLEKPIDPKQPEE